MPLCYCISGGCREQGGIDPLSGKPKGLSISARLHEKHALEDRILAVKEAENRAQAAVDSQLEEITTYLSTSTLADRVSGSSSILGGRLWSRADDDEAIFPIRDSRNSSKSRSPPNRPEHTYGTRSPQSQRSPRSPPTHRSRRDEILSCLADLESEVKEVVDNVSLRLDSLVPFSPIGPPSPFPLLDCLETLDSLQHRLETVTFEGPQSLAFKANISTHLASTEAKLHLAKRQWDNDVSTARMKQTPTYGVFYDTGMLFNVFNNRG
jgi:hypothetical protein